MKNDLLNKVAKYIEDNHMLKKGDRVVIGVSGGADSVTLFYVLVALRKQYSLDLTVVCVNHGLRPEAEEEVEYVRRLCESEEVSFVTEKFDVNEESRKLGMGTEEAGRLLRYRIFQEIAGETGLIAVAHNMNDRAETMLFHLCRGTGPKGAEAIKAVSGNRIRPLLCVSRAEIENFLNEKGVKFYIDASNLENVYTRNKLRNVIFPMLTKEINAASIEHFARFSEIIECENDFIRNEAARKLADIVIKSDDECVIVQRSEFNKLHLAIKRELSKVFIDMLVKFNKDITLSHLDAIIETSAKVGNFSINLPYNLKALMDYDSLSIVRDVKSAKSGGEACEEFVLPAEGLINIENFGTVKAELPGDVSLADISFMEYTKCFDYDKIKLQPTLRHRREGDYLTINRTMGTKKLKDYLIDKKIPKAERDRLYVIADGSHIMWVIGDRISEYYKVTEQTKRVLRISIVNQEQKRGQNGKTQCAGND